MRAPPHALVGRENTGNQLSLFGHERFGICTLRHSKVKPFMLHPGSLHLHRFCRVLLRGWHRCPASVEVELVDKVCCGRLELF